MPNMLKLMQEAHINALSLKEKHELSTPVSDTDNGYTESTTFEQHR